MNFLDLAADEYKRKLKELDNVIEDKKSDVLNMNKTHQEQTDKINMQNKKIEKLKNDIEKFEKIASGNIEKYTKDLDSIKAKVEKQEETQAEEPPVIIWTGSSRRSKERRK